MGLLHDIQLDATNSDVSLSNLLRRCMILAYKLNNAEFKQWVEHEINGYPNDIPVPAYRIHKNEPRANAISYSVRITDGSLPYGAIPAEYYAKATELHFREGVAHFINIPDDGTLKSYWEQALVEIVNRRIDKRMQITQAYIPISPGVFTGMLDVIRNKILEFALKIEAENPDADTVPSGSNPIPQEKVNQIFYTTVVGPASVGGNFQQLVVNGKEDLRQTLLEQGADPECLDELDEVLDEVNPDEAREKQGKVGAWVKKAFGGAAEQGKDLAAKTIATYLDMQMKGLGG